MKKKRNLIITIIIIFLITIITSITLIIKNKTTNIKDTRSLWNIYDINIEKIKNNLDPITLPNEYFFWWELKDFNIEDKEYQSTLNTLLSDIRMCYLEYTDDGTLYTKSNPIREYRDKNKIYKKELETLILEMKYESRNGCLDRFNRYSGVLLSSNQEQTDNFLSKLNPLYTFRQTDLFDQANITYNELLSRKIMEVSLIEDLSEFIVSEYYRLK